MARSKRVIMHQPEDRPAPLKLFSCTDHDGFEHGNRVSSIVLARDADEATGLLDAALAKVGLRPHKMYRYQLQEIPSTKPMAEILSDGDY